MAVLQRMRTRAGMLAWVVTLGVVCAETSAGAEPASGSAPASAPGTGAPARMPRFQVALAPEPDTHQSHPDWWRDYSGNEMQLEEPMLEREATHLVLQEDRPDGPDMLTLRCPLVSSNRLRAYAGAGLGEVVYLADNGVGPILLFGRAERHRSVRAAAEAGTDLRLSDALFVGADVRWLDLADDTSLLRTRTGMVDAAPWAARLTLGWRFR